MNVIERFHWWFTGEVAKTIEEKYDDSADAILFPVLSALFAVMCFYSVMQVIDYGNVFSILVGAVFAGPGLAFAILFIVSVAASIRFSREWTQPEPRPEVLDD